jgi:molybdopterin molybdotransferase
MLSVSEAQQLVLQQAQPLAPQSIPLTADVLGLILAEDIVSDLDMPPFDKAMMDGYAVRSADLVQGRALLQVVDEVTAGQVPRRAVGKGEATRIMTGAPLPQGADAVVMVERTRLGEGGRVTIEDAAAPGQHVMKRGKEMRQGDKVLRAGTPLRPQEVGLLATVGRPKVLLHPAPRLAILSTGDELVPVSQQPGPGQIRNGNGPMLAAQAKRAGAIVVFQDMARDNRESLRAAITQGLQADILVLSGGVSAGKLDLVPGVLGEVGVAGHFHKVAMKPGKPIFFGSHNSTLVFGLPGNPVSAMVCFELFVRPAIRRLRGEAVAGPTVVKATLVENFTYRTDRPTYHPARLEMSESGWEVRVVPWLGSPDLRGLTRANAFVVFPAGDHQHPAGGQFEVLQVE